VKLLLANNHSPKFVDFYGSLAEQSDEPFDYAAYTSLLFIFDVTAERPVEVRNLQHQKDLAEYDGVYINGYLNTYELATSAAHACDSLGIGYANQELQNAPSLSKLSMYAKLAAGRVSLPVSIGGSKAALLQADDYAERVGFPAILKRADADRGIDNFKVGSFEEVRELLTDHADRSLWILQQFIENDGFYLVSFYDSEPAFCIYRTLEERPDKDERKAHMFKPKGGTNASLIELPDVPKPLMTTAQKAVQVMNRQIASVDCLYSQETGKVYVLEVNYNPQLVTIETFKDIRVNAFLGYLKSLGQ
jgi:glutathione synthase/RimK-type ligase-like ATP-grasp enzyme